MTTFAFARGEARDGAPERARRMDQTGEGVQARQGAEEGEARRERAREKANCASDCDGEPKGGLTGEWRDEIRAKKQQLRQEGATHEEITEAIKAMLDEYGVAPPKGAMQRMRAGEGREFQGRQEGKEARKGGEGRGEQRRVREADEDGPRHDGERAGRGEGGRQRARDGEGK